MTRKADFQTLHPGVYFLDSTDLPALNVYFAEGERLRPGETLLDAEKAGEGNMNCTVRIRTTLGCVHNTIAVRARLVQLEEWTTNGFYI